MTDILERLRNRINDSHLDAEYMMDDAAKEIERLRAENRTLRNLLAEGDRKPSRSHD